MNKTEIIPHNNTDNSSTKITYGGDDLTTGTKLDTALASAKGLAADFKTFSLDTDNQEAKQMFNQLSGSMENIAQTLQSRVDFVKQEEPQYNK